MADITLTFDNGPCPKTTPGVLRLLDERNLSAYFCLVARQLERGQEQVDIAAETRARGHILVNHSFTHGVALGDDPSREHASHEVTDAHQLLCDALGAWGEPWFRPFGRGGELGRHLLSGPSVDALMAHDYSVLLWSSVPRDWEDADGWVATALEQTASPEHSVIVLHDLDTGAMAHLAEFLDAALERGDVFTQALPDDCVPMRAGQRAWSNERFQAIVTD